MALVSGPEPARRGAPGRGAGAPGRRSSGSTPTRCGRPPASRSAACRRSATPARSPTFVDEDLLGSTTCGPRRARRATCSAWRRPTSCGSPAAWWRRCARLSAGDGRPAGRSGRAAGGHNYDPLRMAETPRNRPDGPARPDDGYAPSALPSTGARVLAFVAILVGGLCGGLIGWAFVDLQCTGDCGVVAGAGRAGRRGHRRRRGGRRRRPRPAGHGRVAHDPARRGRASPTDLAGRRSAEAQPAEALGVRHARLGRPSRPCGPAPARPPARGRRPAGSRGRRPPRPWRRRRPPCRPRRRARACPTAAPRRPGGRGPASGK